MSNKSVVPKSKIDKVGRILSKNSEITEESIDLEEIFDQFRAFHLDPISKTTIEIQHWMHEYGSGYYIAQRLKRKPQILRKLRRLSVRLTQLQDIGGCRIIVDDNRDVDKLVEFLKDKIKLVKEMSLIRVTDYREKGRDDTGYRAVHIILKRDEFFLELQIRSRMQHYWSESIERTSVVYGRFLKEKDGDTKVINYFKMLSDVFFELEGSRTPKVQDKNRLERLRIEAADIIEQSDKKGILYNFVNEDIVKTLESTEGGTEMLNNWIIVFDWNSGQFVTWDRVDRDPETAVKKYVEYENQFTSEENFEVVMIGSSDIASVRKTHSHYFGIQQYENILENLDESLMGMSEKMDIDVGARQILGVLSRKKYWGRKAVSLDTLKNHYLKGTIFTEKSLDILKEKGLINMADSQSPVSLNLAKKSDIDRYLQ